MRVREARRGAGVRPSRTRNRTSGDALADELERHLEQGGATVLVAPRLDPLVVDLGDGDARQPTLAAPRATPRRRPRCPAARARSWRARCVSATRTTPAIAARGGLSTYARAARCWPPPTSALDGLGAALAPGSSADEETGGENAFGGFPFGERAREEVLSCAFSRAVMEASKRRAAGHTNYYAAIVRSARGAGGAVTMDDGDAGEFGYEEFVVHRPAGDNWLGGAAPPPTTVRRASFGPKLSALERVCGERNECQGGLRGGTESEKARRRSARAGGIFAEGARQGIEATIQRRYRR